MDKVIAWAASQFISIDWSATIGLICLVIYVVDSTYLSYNPKIASNNTLQRIAPLIRALGEKLAPPAVTMAIETCMLKQKTVTATETTTVSGQTTETGGTDPKAGKAGEEAP